MNKKIEATKAGERTPPIQFEPIPGEHSGYAALSIYPPNGFINNKGFSVFVGGDGQGEQKTIEKAEAYLLERAQIYCQRQIDRATATVIYYGERLKTLQVGGLKPATKQTA